MKTLSVRARMTVWYGAMMTVFIGLFAGAIFWLTVRSFADRIDFELSEEVAELSLEVVSATDRDELLRELEANFGRHESYEFEIFRLGGPLMFRSQRLKDESLRPRNVMPTFQKQEEFYEVTIAHLGTYRVLRRSVSSRHGELLIEAAIPLQPLTTLKSELLSALCLLGPCVIVLAIGGGYGMAGRLLAPITEITQTANAITAQDLKSRIEVSSTDDEISRLARTLNEMIDRLDRAFEDMQRFTADAAHELRTPLTIMRTQLDVALRTDRTVDAYRSVLISVRDDVDRMTRLATQLLELAREDAGLVTPTSAAVSLHELVEQAVQQLLPQATCKGVQIDATQLACVELQSDAERLQRVVLNVLDNAVKYAADNGHVAVRLTRWTDDGDALIEITDDGLGIRPEHLPFVFDRFYRADSARSAAGTGLGLAISKAIITSLGGQITIKNRSDSSSPNDQPHGVIASITVPFEASPQRFNQ